MAQKQSKTTKAIERNPKLTKEQADKCDKGIHTYIMFKPGLMGCYFCGARKGGLPPISKADLVQAQASAKGGSKTKGTLTAKKTDDGKKDN